MRVAVINDCAYVGETILKYLPKNIDTMHIKRTRGLWNKTFGLVYKIWKARADIYHVHYLLQDCYIASRIGKKPLIGHAHGSDLRTSLDHSIWRRLVKHNLETCNKILVSTPDVLERARQFREDAEYLPNPVDEEYFYLKPMLPHGAKKKVLIASDSNWRVKGTDVAIRALSKIKDDVDTSIISYGVDFKKTIALASSLSLRLNVLPKISHEKLNEYYWSADVVIDRIKLGSLGMVSLEAIACGRPVVTYVSSDYTEYKDFPLRDVSAEEEVASAVRDAEIKLQENEYAYLKRNHNIENIIQRLLEIYKATCNQ
jgi:glycosyltransferase involved in cell wall biosynthesis